jgi:hypothetical protein
MLEITFQIASPFLVLAGLILLYKYHCIPARKLIPGSPFDKVVKEIEIKHGVRIYLSCLMPVDFTVFNTKTSNNYHVSYNVTIGKFIVEPSGFVPINYMLWKDVVTMVSLLNKNMEYRLN